MARLTEARSGSVLQFGLATVPFLILFLYFLFEASVRPYKPNHNMSDDVTDDVAWEQARNASENEIPLGDMLVCFVVFLILFCTLAVYIIVFIPKRRSLMKLFLDKGETVLGDVVYDEVDSTNWDCQLTRYATAVYPHSDNKSDMIHKTVRVYQYYTREQTTLLSLPNKPLSAQPKTDIELDLEASAERRAMTKDLSLLLLAWIIFLFLGSLYVLIQMALVDDEDSSAGWRMFGFLVGIGLPVVAFGGNFFRWQIYRFWLVDYAAEVKKEAARPNTEMSYVSMEAA